MRLRRDDVAGPRPKFRKLRFQMIADTNSEGQAEIRIEQFTNGLWNPVEWDDEQAKPFTHLVRPWKCKGPTGLPNGIPEGILGMKKPLLRVA